MSIRLRELIRAVRACKTAAEERDVIAKESAALREAFREGEINLRHRNVAKLMYIHMLGYPTHFGQMECLKLIAANGFAEKRIGYLGLMILLDERQEVLMLVTNSLKMDLNHKNQYIVGLALAALGNICSAEMARDLAPDVERLMESPNPYIRKKAALCTRRIIRKVPDLVEQFADRTAELVHDKNHGVLLCGITLMLEICEAEPSVVDKYRAHVPLLCKILRSLLSGGYSPEHDVGGINDPFLQVKILRLLRLLGRGHTEASDQMSDILAQVAANIDANRNAGNAILYECVQTIMAIESIGGLRVLAVNILGRFLANKDNNIRYVALNTLARVVSVDTQAVQRHRVTIVDCVKDADVSIRRRALELVYSLVNESNIRNLTKELLDYLAVSDAEFKPDLTAKICTLIQRFAPDKRWHIDNLIAVMSQAGAYVKEEVCRALVVLVANALELHGYAVRRMFTAARGKMDTAAPSLLTTALWTVGEFGEMLLPGAGGPLLEEEPPLHVTDSEVVDLIEAALKLSNGAPAVKEYALTAALKLTARLPAQQARLQALIARHRNSVLLEVQQRSCEFTQLFKHDRIRPQLLERMPALDESSYAPSMAAAAASTSRSGSGGGAAAASTTNLPAPAAQDDLVDLLGGGDVAAAAAPQSAVDALDELLGGVASASSSAGPSAAPSAGGDLLDILGGALPAAGAAAAAPSSMPMAAEDPFGMLGVAPAAAPAPPAAPQFPSVTVWSKGSLSVSFSFAKEPLDPSTTMITATYTNTGPSDVTDFIFSAAVPKMMQIRMEPASSSTLPALGLGSASQRMVVTNSMHGQKPLVMRLRITYSVDGQKAVEQADFNSFPQGL